jgi:short subunit dehydrogenase-like uncharacterized protein
MGGEPNSVRGVSGSDRELDVVVYGATGFVGKLTAEYLASHAPEGVRIGLGGRSQEKLERVRSELGPGAADWPLIVADSQDRAALDELVRRTRAVATTVGPYMAYGRDLVDACTAAGTHYADLTGEVLFIRSTIEAADDAAKAGGARIVHGCGFDSIPSDLGVHLLHERVSADGAGTLEDTTLVVRAMRGGMSGGTIASMKGQVDEMKRDGETRKKVSDPYALSPDRASEPDLGRESDLRGVEYSDELKTWFGPFVMAGINTRVVRRSNALRDWAYGRTFKYREVQAFGDGIQGRAMATALAGGVGALVGGLLLPPTRFVLDRVLPDPGEGPNEKAREKGFFKIAVHTRTTTGRKYVARVESQGDPGYKATAVMLGESALCLALDEERLPAAAGVLTPSTAMGDVLVERLRAAGMTLEAEPAS